MLISGKGKCIQAVWLFRNSFLWKINFGVWFVQTFYGKCFPFYGKSIPMFGSVKHFTKNGIRFLRKINSGVWFVQTFYGKCVPFYRKSIPMFGSFKHFKTEFVLRKINSHVWFMDHFTENMKCLTNSTPALPRQTCDSTKIIIHFNIKNNHPNIPIIFISK